MHACSHAQTLFPGQGIRANRCGSRRKDDDKPSARSCFAPQLAVQSSLVSFSTWLVEGYPTFSFFFLLLPDLTALREEIEEGEGGQLLSHVVLQCVVDISYTGAWLFYLAYVCRVGR